MKTLDNESEAILKVIRKLVASTSSATGTDSRTGQPLENLSSQSLLKGVEGVP